MATNERIKKSLTRMPAYRRRTTRLLADLSHRLQAELAKRNMTQTALAEKMGVHKSYMSEICAGNVNVTLETIARLEEALGAQLFFFEPLSEVEEQTLMEERASS